MHFFVWNISGKIDYEIEKMILHNLICIQKNSILRNLNQIIKFQNLNRYFEGVRILFRFIYKSAQWAQTKPPPQLAKGPNIFTEMYSIVHLFTPFIVIIAQIHPNWKRCVSINFFSYTYSMPWLLFFVLRAHVWCEYVGMWVRMPQDGIRSRFEDEDERYNRQSQ